MEDRIYNFSAGPAILPEEVLKEAQEDLMALPGVGMSILEISHRSKTFDAVMEQTKANIKNLLNISDDYSIMFLQFGASLQFSMVPMNIMPPKNSADYIVTGAWSKKAVKEAKRAGKVNIAATTEETTFNKIPKQDEIKLSGDASYVHFTSNNTIYGTQFKSEPETGSVPLVCDASSDIFHKKIDVNKYGIIYAGAQKNMGPSGVTMVIFRNDLLERSSDDLPTMLNYKTHVEKDSMFNIKCTRPINIKPEYYMTVLITVTVFTKDTLKKTVAL
jgi:phosphoserine aminotransferase